MSLKASIGFAAAFASTAFAHGFVNTFKVNGVSQQGFDLSYYYDIQNGIPVPDVAGWYAENLDSGFVAPSEYKTSDINCHKASKPGAISAQVPAGGEVDFVWNTWPHELGPVVDYIASCNGDCSSADKSSLKWVKIAEEGIDVATQQWAAGKLMENGNTWKVTVPSSLAPGQYVIRHEIIALHGAGSANGAQNYPQCINFEVTGSGSTQLPSGTLGVDLYNSNDPGILFNPYQDVTSYDIPGPAVWSGALARRHSRDF